MKFTPEMKERIEKSGVKPCVVSTRLRRGWTLDAALDTPAIPNDKRGSKYLVGNDGELDDAVTGTANAAKRTTELCGGILVVTKNMIIGQIYRKGYALFEVKGSKYAVGPAETKEKELK